MMLSSEPIALGQRLMALLFDGRRTTTYKLATLLALVDWCVENLPAEPNAVAQVPIADLADRVIEFYWPQVAEYAGITGEFHKVLKQGSPKVKGVAIADQVASLRTQCLTSDITNPQMARAKSPHYEPTHVNVASTLARYPIPLLQKLGNEPSHDFLFDSSSVGRSPQSTVALFPGVAWQLAHIAVFIRPVIESHWIEEVRRFNKGSLLDDTLAEHLFGQDRESVSRLGPSLLESQSGDCFYCRESIKHGQLHVDHVIPVARMHLPGLANLVATDARCNGNKSASLPSHTWIAKSLARDSAMLEEISTANNWPVLTPRTTAAAQGIYNVLPKGTMLWRGIDDFEEYDPAA